jgi:hypothetical protein
VLARSGTLELVAGGIHMTIGGWLAGREASHTRPTQVQNRSEPATRMAAAAGSAQEPNAGAVRNVLFVGAIVHLHKDFF